MSGPRGGAQCEPAGLQLRALATCWSQSDSSPFPLLVLRRTPSGVSSRPSQAPSGDGQASIRIGAAQYQFSSVAPSGGVLPACEHLRYQHRALASATASTASSVGGSPSAPN